MATLGVNSTVGSFGPSGGDDPAHSNLFAVIQSPWGVPNIPQVATSYDEYYRLYGGLDHIATVAAGTTPDAFSFVTDADVQQGHYAIKAYFDEKGPNSPGVAFICRVIDTTSGPTAATKNFPDAGVNNTVITSKWPGLHGATTQVTITNPSPVDPSYCQIYLSHPRSGIEETWQIKTATDAANATKLSQLVTITLPAGGQLPVSAAASKLQSGTPATAETYDASDADLVGTTTAAGVKSGIQVFTDRRFGSGFVTVPGKYSSTVRSGIITHCADYWRIAMLGASPSLVLNTVTTDDNSATGNDATYSWPQLFVRDITGAGDGQILIDNGGPIAGLWARMDQEYSGPHKSPAGITHPFRAVIDVERASNGAELVDDAGSNSLADQFINTARIKGEPPAPVMWGLRSRATDPRFRQINVVHMIHVLRHKGTRILERYFAEPINYAIFPRVQADLNAMMAPLFDAGAFYGTKPGTSPKSTDAWRVVCDKSNNPDIKVGAGILTASVYFVAAPNAERIDFNLVASAPGSLGGLGT